MAEDTPGTVLFPDALDSIASLIRITNKITPRLVLDGSLAADMGVTEIDFFNDGTLAPTSGIFAIDNEIFLYTDIELDGTAGGTFTGVVRAANGSTLSTHGGFTPIEFRYVALFHQTLSLAIRNIEARLGIGPVLAIELGGTNADNVSDARIELGLEIGADVQAWDADLTAVAGLTTTGFVKRTGAGTFSAGALIVVDIPDLSSVYELIDANITRLGSSIDLSGAEVTGVLPDGKLSSNVVLENALNIFTVRQTIDFGTLGDTSIYGLVIRTTTPATALVPIQNPPLVIFRAHGWYDDESRDTKLEMNERFEILPGNTRKARFSWEWSQDDEPYVMKQYIADDGGIFGASYIESGIGFVVAGLILTESSMAFSTAQASISNTNTTNPFKFQSNNVAATAFRFIAATALTSGNLIEGIVPDSGFTGSLLKLGKSSNGSTITTVLFEFNAGGAVMTGNAPSVFNIAGTNSYARISVNSVTGSPNAGIELLENGTLRWSIASFGGGTFTFYNEVLVAEAIGIDGSNNLATFGGIVAAPAFRGIPVTFANVPASPVEGMMVTITDSSTGTWGATITGGGANHVLGYFNGSAWTVAAK